MTRTPPPLALSLCIVVLAAASCSSAERPTGVMSPAAVAASVGQPISADSKNAYTLAVIGDTPYGAAKVAEFPSFVALVNGDPKVDVVVHLGDIEAGKNSPCSDANFASVRAMFDGFRDPLVDTPGDNEWTDCHVASKNNGLYVPTERLQAVRALFFPVPGQTLGGRPQRVLTQADVDPANAAFVENVLWMQSRTVFATVNITGSNNDLVNDLVSWGAPLPADAGNYPSQAQEYAARAQADAAWIARAFALARAQDAAAVVLMFQADMWDTAEPSLSGYDALVRQIGTLAAAFGKPVLILEGDSHEFRVDNPYAASSPLHAVHAGTPVADNVTRVVVEGSDKGDTEYLRLTVDPNGPRAPLFTWERVPLLR